MTEEELERLHKLPKLIEQKRWLLQRLRDQVGLRSSQITGMPHSSGVHDRIGEIVPDIADVETEIAELEKELTRLQFAVMDWISHIDDIKAAYILSLRFIEGYGWKQIADEISSTEGAPVADDAGRKYYQRYMKAHCK